MEAAIFGFIGVLIGSLASLGGIYIQQIHQSRQERLKMAVDLAMKEFEHDIDLAKRENGTTYIAPLPAYVVCHLEYLEALSKESLTPEKIHVISAKTSLLTDSFNQLGDLPLSIKFELRQT